MASFQTVEKYLLPQDGCHGGEVNQPAGDRARKNTGALSSRPQRLPFTSPLVDSPVHPPPDTCRPLCSLRLSSPTELHPPFPLIRKAPVKPAQGKAPTPTQCRCHLVPMDPQSPCVPSEAPPASGPCPSFISLLSLPGFPFPPPSLSLHPPLPHRTNQESSVFSFITQLAKNWYPPSLITGWQPLPPTPRQTQEGPLPGLGPFPVLRPPVLSSARHAPRLS